MTTANIWNNFKDEIHGFIKTRVNSPENAEDILQDVFAKIHRKASTIKEKEKLTSWVYQITRNTIIDYYKKKKLLTYTDNLNTSLPEKIDENISKDFSKCLQPLINKLADKDRDALHKTSFENMSQKDYAKEQGISYSTAKSRVQRARQKLKTLFVECCQIEADKYGNIIDSK